MKWEDVKKEMVETKGLPAENADKIGKFVELAGNFFANDFLLILR